MNVGKSTNALTKTKPMLNLTEGTPRPTHNSLAPTCKKDFPRSKVCDVTNTCEIFALLKNWYIIVVGTTVGQKIVVPRGAFLKSLTAYNSPL